MLLLYPQTGTQELAGRETEGRGRAARPVGTLTSVGQSRASSEHFPSPSHTAHQRKPCSWVFSISASQLMPSSSGLPGWRLTGVLLHRNSKLGHTSSPPWNRQDHHLSTKCHLDTCSGIKPDGRRQDHKGPTCRGSTSQAFQERSFQRILHQSTTLGRHVFTLACLHHVCRMGALRRSELC